MEWLNGTAAQPGRVQESRIHHSKKRNRYESMKEKHTEHVHTPAHTQIEGSQDHLGGEANGTFFKWKAFLRMT